MVVNMLKAISQILDENCDPQALAVRVACARKMIDEIIKGMDVGQPISNWPPEVTPTGTTGTPPLKRAPTTSTLSAELEPKEPEYKLEINADKTLKSIMRDGKPISLTQELLVDGIKMTYEKAVGKPFRNIKVIE